MYKDKKIGIFNQISRQNVILLIILFGAIILLIYGISWSKRSLIENNTNKHIDIHSGHYLTEIDYENILKDVKPEYKERCMSILQGKKNIDPDLMWSLSFEDWFIYHNFFKHDSYHFHSKSDFDNKLTQKKSFGVYMDIGDYRPYYQSNSAFFDLCLGWAGIIYIYLINIYI